jgi:3-carboxy-cis,cis-muconate cycloisomerase
VTGLADSGLLSPVRAGPVAEALVSDEAWLQAMLHAEVALVRVQSRLGVVPAAAADIVAGCADADGFDLVALAQQARESANPVVALVQALTERVRLVDGDAAHYVHRGSTSQDILDTAAMLVAAQSLSQTLADLDRVAVAVARLADEHRLTPMAGRTLTQHAVPTTFGLKAAGWLVAVVDASGRLKRVRAQLPVQIGGAAGTLAGYLEYARLSGSSDSESPATPEALVRGFAAELGLAEPVLPWHSLRGPLADLGAALSYTTGTLGKIAVDVLSLTRTEVGELTEPSATGRGTSSAMPQKRNPVLAALIRSAALQVPALVSVLSHSQLAEDERSAGVWQAEWQPLRECLRLTGGAAEVAAELTEGLQVHPERMLANLAMTGGLIVSERIAAVLAPVLGKTAAKTLVSSAAAQATAEQIEFSAALMSSPELEGVVEPGELAGLLDPDGYLGAAGWLVERALSYKGVT